MKRYFPDIPEVYPDRFPEDYVNDVQGWAFSRKQIKENYGSLLTLDIEFGTICSLNCPFCWRRGSNLPEKGDHVLSSSEIKQIILDAKALGLKSVKVVGKGEPFEDPEFIDFLVFLHDMEIIPLVFTKGHVFGDDAMVKRIYGHQGIDSGDKLVRILKENNVSIILGVNSFNPESQEKFVGNVAGFTAKRNHALELLIAHGFNIGNPTKLAFASAPILKENYKELTEIYKWGRKRNIYVGLCPAMVNGRAKKDDYWRKTTPDPETLIDMYTEIYRFNIDTGLQSLEQVKSEGIASYAGAHPCNQVSTGMYININGKVLRCPGDDFTTFGNIRDKTLYDIWLNSENRARCGCFNCKCPPKWGESIPFDLYDRVLENLEKAYS